jgi:hypothetical protein
VGFHSISLAGASLAIPLAGKLDETPFHDYNSGISRPTCGLPTTRSEPEAATDRRLITFGHFYGPGFKKELAAIFSQSLPKSILASWAARSPNSQLAGVYSAADLVSC